MAPSPDTTAAATFTSTVIFLLVSSMVQLIVITSVATISTSLGWSISISGGVTAITIHEINIFNLIFLLSDILSIFFFAFKVIESTCSNN
jgi:hypothetical protein